MKVTISVLAALLLAASASSASSASKAHSKPAAKAPTGQTYARGHCRVTVPRSWTDYRGGRADPKNREFGVTLGSVGDSKSMTATVKAMHGRTLSDESSLTLMMVRLRGRDAKQYWSITKPGPGCRATVTFADFDHDAAAKKIAQSLKKVK